MESFGVCILLSVILWLVDRNQAWPKFWRVLKRATISCIVLVVLGVIAFYSYDHYQKKKAEAELAAQWKPVAETITPETTLSAQDIRDLRDIESRLPADDERRAKINSILKAHGEGIDHGPWEKYQQQEAGDFRKACAAKARAAFPGSYDDVDDATLTTKLLAKFPNYCREFEWHDYVPPKTK